MPKLSTASIHAANHLHRVSDVTPPINISTTFRYDKNPENLKKATEIPQIEEILTYSRHNHPNGLLVEETIGQITGSHAVVYTSGLAAFYALMTHLNPKQLFIGDSYHGCHEIADIITRNYGLQRKTLAPADLEYLQPGDLVHIETPINPTSLCCDITKYAEVVHNRGAILSVDSTFAPLQDPFEFGADIVLHSATKYFGGHSDLLAGLLLTKSAKVKEQLLLDRICLGTNIANLESSLLFRSLKTFELRVRRQSSSATKIARYLHENIGKLPGLVDVKHSSLQTDDFVSAQLKGQHSPSFSFFVTSEELARVFPSRLKYFYHATSLGGVESLIEWKILMDASAPPTLLRLSIGLEDPEDLIDDLKQAFNT